MSETPQGRFVLTYNLVAVVPINDLHQIVSRTEMAVWNGFAQKWIEDGDASAVGVAMATETVYRNIMLSMLHPDHEFSICAIPTNATAEDESLLDDYDNFSLDLAGGSRKHGHFMFTRQKGEPATVGQFYFPESKRNMGRINYGSICLSENKALFELRNAKILVVPDPDFQNNRPVPGSENPWNIGDAHGKIRASLLTQLLEGIVKDPNLRRRTPTQFRLGIPGSEDVEGIWGKGTVLPVDNLDGYDLVLPESCFKTYKPSSGENRFDKVYIAALGEAQERKSRGGTQIWSWFPIEIIEQDVMPATRQECERIVKAIQSQDVYKVFELFNPRIERLEARSEDIVNKWFDELQEAWAGGNPDDETDDNSEIYMPALAQILEYDTARILERHPYVIDATKRSLKKKWTRLAINGAVRMKSFMAQPDDSLADLTFTCKHIENTEHITYRYPVRHWGDIQLWNCVAKPSNDEYDGVFFVSHVTFGGTGINGEAPHGQGGDFDGDYGNAIASSELPNITQRIRDWEDENSPHYRPRPGVIKAPKNPIQDSLKQVALRSMDNQTGLVASLIMHAQAKGLTEEIVPDGTGRTVLEVLSQALQDEVDRFKNDLQRDTKGIEEVQKILTRGSTRPIWQGDYKSADAYLTRPMEVGSPSEDNDTISYMIREVNVYWQAASFPEPEKLGSNKFRYLFGQNPMTTGVVTQRQIDFARAGQREYNRRLTNAIRVSDIDDSAIRKLMRDVKEQRIRLENELKATLPFAEAKAKLKSWAIAYWWVAHNERAGDSPDVPMGKAGLPFLLFPDLIAEQLATGQYTFRIFGIQHQDPPNFVSRIPIIDWINVILIGTRVVMERSFQVLYPDENGRAVYINSRGDFALARRSIGNGNYGFVDNDFTIYVYENVERHLAYTDADGRFILTDEDLGDRHFYLTPNNGIIIKNQAPPPPTYTDADGNLGLFKYIQPDGSVAFVDITNDYTPHVFLQVDENIYYTDISNNILLNESLPDGSYFYLSASDGSIFISNERPHPRKRQEQRPTDSILVKIKGNEPRRNYNLGIVDASNVTSIRVGQILYARMRSYVGQNGQPSRNSVEVVVNGSPRKDYVIAPVQGNPDFMFLNWDDDVELYTADFQQEVDGPIRKMVYVTSHRTGGEAKAIGVLPLDCDVIPNGGRKIVAHLKRVDAIWETIFTPL